MAENTQLRAAGVGMLVLVGSKRKIVPVGRGRAGIRYSQYQNRPDVVLMEPEGFVQPAAQIHALTDATLILFDSGLQVDFVPGRKASEARIVRRPRT